MQALTSRRSPLTGFGFALLGCLAAAGETSASERIAFPLTRPVILDAKGPGCLPDAKGAVFVRAFGGAELMTVRVKGLPAETNFDVFVIQVPNFPFGMSWYQGDLETNRYGRGTASFIGRFNEETFIVSPKPAEGSAPPPAPQTHTEAPFADAAQAPATAPVHTYHVGIWFNSPEDAAAAGCPGATTPFNGEHRAGIQILNTGTFPDTEGPLLQLKP